MEQLRDREKVAGLLRQVLETYGVDLLENHQRLNALLMDYMPQYDRERKLLVRALELGIGGELLRVRDKSREEKRIVMNQCRAELESEMMLVRSAAEYLIIVIIEAFRDKSTEPQKQIKTKQKSTSQRTNQKKPQGENTQNKENKSSAWKTAVPADQVTTITFCDYIIQNMSDTWAVPDIGANARAWAVKETDGYHLYIGESGGVKANKSGPRFSKYPNVRSICFIGNYDTSVTVSMERMFSDCSRLTDLNLKGIKTSCVTNMAQMFRGCSRLTKLDLKNFNTSNVTNMIGMFWDCSGLTKLDLSSFDTSNVLFMDNMFWKCTGLSKLITSDERLNTEFAKVCEEKAEKKHNATNPGPDSMTSNKKNNTQTKSPQPNINQMRTNESTRLKNVMANIVREIVDIIKSIFFAYLFLFGGGIFGFVTMCLLMVINRFLNLFTSIRIPFSLIMVVSVICGYIGVICFIKIIKSKSSSSKEFIIKCVLGILLGAILGGILMPSLVDSYEGNESAENVSIETEQQAEDAIPETKQQTGDVLPEKKKQTKAEKKQAKKLASVYDMMVDKDFSGVRKWFADGRGGLEHNFTLYFYQDGKICDTIASGTGMIASYYGIYLGEIQNNRRVGSGIQFGYDVNQADTAYTVTEGQWDANMANGQCEYTTYNYTTENGESYTSVYTGNVTDNLFNGDITVTNTRLSDNYSNSYTMHVENGVISSSGTDENGNYIIGYASDGSYWHTTEDGLKNRGIWADYV